ncbi:MAG: hypothetical protein K9M02_10305 [Thiohalocapsa sp.]|nr:hypothetical protein [Thiohalocapsa sp.]
MKALLAGIAVLLSGVLLLQWKDWPPDVPQPPPPVQALPGEQQPPPVRDVDDVLSVPPVEDYVAVTDRPLFLPERRPPPDEPQGQAEELPMEFTELDGMDLTAIVITPDVVSAWVRSPASPEAVRVRLGDDLEGWTVKTIEPQRLVLERQGEVDELQLRDYENAAAAVPMPTGPRRRPPMRSRQPNAPQRPSRAPAASDQLPPQPDH